MASTRITKQINRRRLYSVGAAVVTAAAVQFGIIGFVAAQSNSDLKPPVGYRNWFHVNTMIVDKASPLFKDLGGMHNVYVNSVGEAALKKGGPYPDKSMYVTDLHDFTVSDGSYVQCARKGVLVMINDSNK